MECKLTLELTIAPINRAIVKYEIEKLTSSIQQLNADIASIEGNSIEPEKYVNRYVDKLPIIDGKLSRHDSARHHFVKAAISLNIIPNLSELSEFKKYESEYSQTTRTSSYTVNPALIRALSRPQEKQSLIGSIDSFLMRFLPRF